MPQRAARRRRRLPQNSRHTGQRLHLLRSLKPRITGKEFVTAQAGKRDCQARLLDGLRDDERINRVLRRLIHRRQRVGQERQKTLFTERNFRVFRAEFVGHAPRVCGFGKFAFGKHNAESLGPCLGYFAHQSDQRARINAAGKEQPQRNVTRQVQPHRFAQDVAQLCNRLGAGLDRRRAFEQIRRVRRFVDTQLFAVGCHFQKMAGPHGPHTGDNGFRFIHRAVMQKRGGPGAVQTARH